MDDIIFNFLMGFAFLKFVQKADTLLRILGLNTARIGDLIHSLGGTIAGIAMAVKSAGNMAHGVTKAAGRLFGNTPNPGAAEGGGGNGDVLNSARLQMRGSESDDGMDGIPGQGSQNGEPSENPDPSIPDASAPGQGTDGQIDMEPGKAPKGGANSDHPIDDETMEGLSNLAHGLPHDKYDPAKGAFSGGGFPEFTGENANIIGASQLTPADGVHRSTVKRADGTTGTIYRNEETGEASIVQFASVDNGVLQGTISQIDPNTGKMGEDFAFKAVHGSVPGADSFSSHTVPVRDASGGSYHVSTGAKTDFLSTAQGGASGLGGNTVQAVGSAYTPGGASKMAAPASGIAGETPVAPSETSTPPMAGGIGGAEGGPAEQPSGGPGYSGSQDVAPMEHGADPGNPIGQGASIQDETPLPNPSSAESPPAGTGMTLPAPQNQVRRFSKDNPANVEVFRRDSGRIETFDKPQPGADATPPVTPPQKPKKERMILNEKL